jgi:hypothetical protein
MANRTDDTEVQKIIALNVLTDTTSFIDTANLLVNENLGTSGLSDARLTEIEKYLAAHLVALHPDERQLTEQKIGEATDKYTGAFGKQLDATQYGQMVMLLDTTGTFRGYSNKITSIQTITVDNG